MKRNNLHLLADLVLLITMLGLILTGFLMALVLPHGSRGATVFGLERSEWGDLHWWIAVVMLVTVLIHVMLNWAWVCTVSARLVQPGHKQPSARNRNLAGVGVVAVLAAIVAAFLLAAGASYEQPDGGRGYQGERAARVEAPANP